MTELDLLVLGDCNPDLILTGDVEPAFGQVERIVDAAALTVGGSGAIVACGAARLGLRVGFIGVVGDDLLGRFMLDSLTEKGVDVGGCITTKRDPTGLSVILAHDRDRAILTALGSISSLTGDQIDRDRLHASRHVHVSSYFLQTSLQADLVAIFTEIRTAGATTSVDPNWDPSSRWDGGLRALLRCIDCFLPNQVEACHIAGRTTAEEAAKALAERASVVAIKQGAAGGLVQSGAEVFKAGAVPVDEIVDTTGAGDSFDAAFLTGRLLDWPLEKCLALACGCGSLSTRSLGGVDAQPTLEEAIDAIGLVDERG